MSVKDTLKGMQKVWGNSQKAYETMFGGEKLPANTYNARLTKCHLKEANGSGNPYIGREFTILEGEHEGGKVYDRIMLHNENGPIFARRFLDQAGATQPQAFSDLVDICASIEDAEMDFQIAVKHNGDFTNVNILKTLSELSEEAEEESEEEEEEEEAEEGEEENEEEEEDEEEESDEELLEPLTVFARSWDVEVPEDTNQEDLIELMKNYAFEEDKMTPEEVELLESAGLEETIERKPKAPAKAAAKIPPKSAPKTPAKAPAKAPAKPLGKKSIPGKKLAPKRR